MSCQNNSNPAEDLRRAPPGLLALDNMVYFSRHTPSAYSRVRAAAWGVSQQKGPPASHPFFLGSESWVLLFGTAQLFGGQLSRMVKWSMGSTDPDVCNMR